MEGGRQSEIAKAILSSKNVPYVVAAPLLIQVGVRLYSGLPACRPAGTGAMRMLIAFVGICLFAWLVVAFGALAAPCPVTLPVYMRRVPTSVHLSSTVPPCFLWSLLLPLFTPAGHGQLGA